MGDGGCNCAGGACGCPTPIVEAPPLRIVGGTIDAPSLYGEIVDIDRFRQRRKHERRIRTIERVAALVIVVLAIIYLLSPSEV